MSLLPDDKLRRIMQCGLLNGYWSVAQFNREVPLNANFTLPTWDFLDAHPRFADMHFRDLEAYRSRHNDTPIL